MEFAKSWFDENQHTWIAINKTIGSYRDDHIAQEFLYAFTGTEVQNDLFDEVLSFISRYYKNYIWKVEDDTFKRIKKDPMHFFANIIAKENDRTKITVHIVVENFIVTNMVIDIDK